MNSHTSSPRSLFTESLSTPVGALVVVTDGEGLVRAVDWADTAVRMHRLLRLHYGPELPAPVRRPDAAPSPALLALRAYFSGDLLAIDAVATATGGTPFQQEVWRALRAIPSGGTVTYGGLARAIDRPRADRAIGAANGANPISIIVPCHRVIGASGTLVGYAGGVERKRWLLTHEGALTPVRQARQAARGSWG